MAPRIPVSRSKLKAAQEAIITLQVPLAQNKAHFVQKFGNYSFLKKFIRSSEAQSIGFRGDLEK